MKNPRFCVLLLLCLFSILQAAEPVKAQMGVMLTGYTLTTPYGMHKFYNSSGILGTSDLGFAANINLRSAFCLDFAYMRLGPEIFKKDYTPTNLGIDSLGYKYLPFKRSEESLQIVLLHHFDKDPKRNDDDNPYWGSELNIRLGYMNVNRMVALTPQTGHLVYYNYGRKVDTIQQLTSYNVTGLQQGMVVLGLMHKRYKLHHNAWFGGGGVQVKKEGDTYYEYNYQAPDPDKQLKSWRRRVWELYADLLYSTTMKFADYQSKGHSFSGSEVGNLNPFGFRAGIKRVCYNPFATQFILETGVYPGQRYDPRLDGDIGKSMSKNWYIFGGFTISIGAWIM